jgi:Tol biopolymer transport system component
LEDRVSLVELLDTAGPLSASDAAAIVVALCRTVPVDDAVGVAKQQLRATDVWLERTGRVHLGPGLMPSVPELGQLLEQLLARIREDRSAHFPPGLVMIAARATGRIDMAPFPSREALAAALLRFAPPDTDAVMKALYESAESARAPSSSTDPDSLASFAAESDVGVVDDYEYQPPATVPAGATAESLDASVRRRRDWRVPAAAAAAVLSLAVGYAAGLLFVQTRGNTRITDATDVIVSPSAGDTRRTAPSKPRTAPAERAPAPTPRVARSAASRKELNRPQPLIDATQAGSDKAYSPSFAPDGSAIFFHAETAAGSALKRAEPGERGVLHVVTILNDSAKNYHVQLSPDGKSVAFDSDRDGVRGVYVARADGTGVRRVSGEGYAAVPTWSPDGRRLALLRAENDRPSVWNLWLLDLASGEMTRLTRYRYGQVWGGAWFPDGRRLAYSHEDRLILLDPGTGRATSHASPIKGRLVRTPAVSPDGRWIIFQVFRDGAWLLNVETGSMQRVLDDASAEEFTWDPGGNRVAFHSRNRGGWGLWVMAARTP